MTNGLHLDPSSRPLQWVIANPSDWRVSVINNIAYQPIAGWFDPWGLGSLDTYLANAKAAGNKLPVLVAYAMTNWNWGCASISQDQSNAYKTWVSTYAQKIGSRPALLILEPDALPQLPCMSSDAQNQRYELFNYAIDQFNTYAPNTWVYLDSGNSNWIDPTLLAQMMVKAGIQRIHGFSLNVSNFRADAELKTYGIKVNDELQRIAGFRRAFVTDTSRNGNGPTADAQWCDPPGRKIGAAPRVQTINGEPEMNLWVKDPGGSDGCAHPSGWWPDIAYNLVLGL